MGALAVVVALAGCGGNVVIDGNPSGGGGEGGGATTTTIPWTTSTTSWTTSNSTTVTIDPGDLTPTCKAYCDAVADKGCFDLTDCHIRCMAFYVDGCTSQVEALLDCLPPVLNSFCQITYPDVGGCDAPASALHQCNVLLNGSCGGTSSLIGDSACKGSIQCPSFDLDVLCDGTGECTCTKGGSDIGTCGMPFAGNEACEWSLSCCWDLL